MISFKDELFVACQRIAPHHAISRCAGWVASSKTPLVKNAFIRWFYKTYQPDMSEAEIEDPFAYTNFNQFFTRALKPGARPLEASATAIASPADGVLSQFGPIAGGRIIQAKGQTFTVGELLGEESSGPSAYDDGQFATVYLSPKDYHRVHMPLAGQLSKMTHIPGRLFSVNAVTTEAVPRLFARNERVVCHFDTEAGPMAVILVGAMIVASIETVWAGTVAPARTGVRHTSYLNTPPIQLDKGAEVGRFFLGSTVVVLLPNSKLKWSAQLAPGSFVRMGQTLGQFGEA